MNKAELLELASKLQLDVTGLNKNQIIRELLAKPEKFAEVQDATLLNKVKIVSMQEEVKDKCDEITRYRRESEMLNAKLYL